MTRGKKGTGKSIGTRLGVKRSWQRAGKLAEATGNNASPMDIRSFMRSIKGDSRLEVLDTARDPSAADQAMINELVADFTRWRMQAKTARRGRTPRGLGVGVLFAIKNLADEYGGLDAVQAGLDTVRKLQYDQ